MFWSYLICGGFAEEEFWLMPKNAKQVLDDSD